MGLVVGFPNKSLQFPSKKDLTVDYKSQIFGQVTPTLPGQKPCKIPHSNASRLVCAVSTKRYFFMCIYSLWLPNILLITWITEQNQLPLCRAQSCLLVKGCLHEICGSAVGSGTGSFESCGMKDSGLYRRGLFRGMLKMLHPIGISALVSWFLKLFVNSPAGGGSSCRGVPVMCV